MNPSPPPGQVVSFLANSVEEAVLDIRSKLGSQAIVTHLRRLEPPGLARLWKKPQLEIFAYRPEEKGHTPIPISFASGAAKPANPRSRAVESHSSVPISSAKSDAVLPSTPTKNFQTLLESVGLLPIHAARFSQAFPTADQLAPAEQLTLVRSILPPLWRPAPPLVEDSIRPHLFIGAPGAGKSNVLCKWLAQVTLVEGRKAQVWRLNGARANQAECLDLMCRVLEVPLFRSWNPPEALPEKTICFIDLPGTDWRDKADLQKLLASIQTFPKPHLHLVLNAAYDLSLLLAQIQAFSALPLDDLILTHVDEELRWGKFWNLIFGTNFSIRFLSGGQNIPGHFVPASPEAILGKL